MITVTFYRIFDSRNKSTYIKRNVKKGGKFKITFCSIEDAAAFMVNSNKDRNNIVYCPELLTKEETIILYRKIIAMVRNQKQQLHTIHF